MTAAAAVAARAIALRMAMNLIKLIVAIVCVLIWSACTSHQTIVITGAQPGGLARLRSAESLQLNGGGLLNGVPIEGTPGFIGPVPVSSILPSPPADQWAAMIAASTHAPCNFPGPQYLAALAFYESSYGRNPGPSSAGAWGYAQFMPISFVEYGITNPQIGNPNGIGNDYHVMLPAMVSKLCHDGIASSIDRALFAYNADRAYVDHIKKLAESLVAISTVRPWQDLPAFNQFDPRNWSNSTNFQVWSAAACSAAALDWMLTAYGSPPGSIDSALALIGANTGISSRVGLMDHTGPALATALGKAGYTPWRGQLTQQQLIARLQRGPAMLDGQAWFGVGHWFVATGSDATGISIRESSGNNVQFLTWARLFGEVGWSGWAVGIDAQPVSNQA
jgi:hypothetical protein